MTTTTTESIDLSTASTDALLSHFESLTDLLVEAYGDHPALAAVRRTICESMDAVEAELVRRHVELPGF